MFGTPWPKLGLLIFLLVGIGILIVGACRSYVTGRLAGSGPPPCLNAMAETRWDIGSALSQTLFLPQPRYGWLSR